MNRLPPISVLISSFLMIIIGGVIAYVLFKGFYESLVNPTSAFELRLAIAAMPVLLFIFWHWFKTAIVLLLGLSRVGLVVLTILSCGLVSMAIREGKGDLLFMGMPLIASGISCVLCFLPMSNRWFRQKQDAVHRKRSNGENATGENV